jgi:hypothetical protein
MKNGLILYLSGLIFLAFIGNAKSEVTESSLYINEFMAANSNTITSPDYDEYADWIELYNAGETSLDISGYFITDDFENPEKWQLPPGTVIQPNATLLFWADGKDEGDHTNFNLSKEGEEIGLYSSEGILIDSISYNDQPSDVSHGRYPNGTGSWFLFENPTPGALNMNTGFTGMCSDPIFYPSGGFFSEGVSVELQKGNPEETIRYTTDGSIPTEESPEYISSGFLDKTTVLRARAFRTGYLPGRVITRTYFINETTELPVVSVATDPDNLWSDESGIYVEGTNGITGYCSSDPRNWNQEWEKPASIEFFEADRSFGFRIDAGLEIGGGCTRLYPQKTLAIYARSEYGFSKIEYPVFTDKPINSYNNLLLRNSGQDWWRALIRDGLVHNLVKNMMDIEWQAYRPAIVFLNGIYWGIHGVREKHNEHYLASNYNIDPYAIDILTGNATIKQGSAELYTQMIDFIGSHDLSQDENYRQVALQMDVDEYLNYVITEIYSANIDWPAGNIKYWRQQGDNHKWRWILFDMDLTFGAHGQGQYNSNTLANATSTVETYYANPPWSTFLLRSLLKNEEFRQRFIQKFASHLNITFAQQRVEHLIDSLKMDIEDEIPRHIQKWEKSTSFNDGWAYHINVMKEFAAKRAGYVISQITDKFGLNGTSELQVTYDDGNMGNIYLEGVQLPDNNFTGIYFKGIPVQCIAVPKKGYRFVQWQGIAESINDSVTITLTGDASLHAEFEAVYTNTGGLRINEFLALNEHTNTDENKEADDWIELYNDSSEPIDIGGMFMSDDLNEPDKWQIPASHPDSTTISPGEFILLWADNDPEQGVLHLDFRLSTNGEEISIARATDSGIVFIDTLKFGPQTADISFGRYPDGSDNFKFFVNPSPGRSNTLTDLKNADREIPEKLWLSQNYPNPFNGSTRIEYHLQGPGKIRLSIYDISGKEVEILFDGWQNDGQHFTNWHPQNLSSGQYYVKLHVGNRKSIRKVLFIK